MRRLILVVLVGVLVSLLPQQAWGIVYGEPDNGEHPNVGSFVAPVVDADSGARELFQTCTGTLIDADVVLSAGHCFAQALDEGTDVYFTLDAVIDMDRDGVVDPGVTLLPGTPVLHPLFASEGYNNTYDLAVFLLEEPVTGVNPALLPEFDVLSGRDLKNETFTTVGYGTVRETNRKGWQSFSSGWRREKVDQQFISHTKAFATFSMNLATDNGGGCYGDSGGPHLLGDVIVSITATGDTPCKATDKTYRLDTAYARDFLRQYVALP